MLEASEAAYTELIKDASNPDTNDKVSIAMIVCILLASLLSLSTLLVSRTKKQYR